MKIKTYKTTDQFIEELKSFDDAKIKQLSAAWLAARDVDQFAARSAVWDADFAILVKDKITAEQFEILTSPWTSCGLSLFVEAEGISMTMTNEEELIAKARKLCGRKIAEWQDVFDELSKYGDAQHQRDEINSWTTHLAEMDQHKAIEHCKNPLCHGPVCSKCGSKETLQTSYPCNELLTKAKRLLGVE